MLQTRRSVKFSEANGDSLLDWRNVHSNRQTRSGSLGRTLWHNIRGKMRNWSSQLIKNIEATYNVFGFDNQPHYHHIRCLLWGKYNFINFLWIKNMLRVEVWQAYHITIMKHLGIQWIQQNKKNKSEKCSCRNRTVKKKKKEV